MKKIFLLFFILPTALFVSAQNKTKVSGTVGTEKNNPIYGAIILLQKANDNTLVKTTLSDSLGYFEFINVPFAQYKLEITNVEYERKVSNVFLLDEQHFVIELHNFALKALIDKQLRQVVVNGKASFVEKKIDRTVINPDAFLGNAGTNALEVLEKSPGIQIDVNGVISLKGKQGVVVYVDDKPTYLSNADLANYLKSLPSSTISAIEIMTNPPAKYDAAGNAGVLNIKLKRTKTMGFNGGLNLSYGQGKYSKSNNSFNFNYRINKFNFFSNVAFNVNNGFQDLFIYRQYYKANGNLSSLFNQNSYIKWETNTATAKLGFDFYATKKLTLGAAVNGFNNNKLNTVSNTAQIYDSAKNIVNNVVAYSPTDRNFKNGAVNINANYKHKKSDWLFNADYIGYKSVTNQSLLNSVYATNGTLQNKSNLISFLPSTIKIKTIKIDYSTLLKNGTKLEGGGKAAFVNTTNVANFYDEQNGTQTVNNEFSNDFTYKENINALYANYSFEKKKWAIQAGLRFENTIIKGYQKGNATHADSAFTRNYNNLFPTFYFLYKLDTTDKHQLSFSYGRRIDRPNYESMNPFTYPLDRYTLYSGNPFLQPTFSDNFELAHTYKNNITTTLSYSYTKNINTETIEQRSNIFYSRPGNLGKNNTYSISVTGAVNVKKWWKIQFYTELTYNEFTSKLYTENLNNKGTFFFINPTNSFQINKLWSAELAATYLTKVTSGQFVLIPSRHVRVGVAKKICNQKGSIKLNISDVFYTNKTGGDIKSIALSNASWKSDLDTRVFTLAFSYRFNKGKSLAARASGASDSEKSRVK